MTDEIVVHESVQLGVVQAQSPQDVVARASAIATELAKIVNKQKLFTIIQGRKYVQVEGWETLGAMLGVLPREVETKRWEDGTYESVVELIRASDGAIIGRGSAVCGADEKSWANRAEYARRSMAITRATGKAYRLAFSWIMALAGYAPTPAEEMDGVIDAEVREVKANPTPEPQPQPEPTNGRPYAPETLRERIGKYSAENTSKKATAQHRKVLASALDGVFNGDSEKRHAISKYLAGSSSTKDMSDGAVWAMLKWLDVGGFNQPPAKVSMDEARNVLKMIEAA
jgi:hypothetical protein